jgi:membrane protease YdiL (CAAX protease family)
MQPESPRPGTIQILHGGILLLLLPLPAFVPALTRWPWYLLAPLLGYAAIVGLVPSLRRSVGWVQFGRFDRLTIVWTAAIMVATSVVLVVWHQLVHPDVSHLASQMPRWQGVPWLWTCLIFAVVNALMEEIVWRGIFMDALASQLGARWALIAQAALFGWAHAQGYPSGAAGVVLAGVYGWLLGFLRQRSGGLAAPLIAHVAADATIYSLVMG